jgi:branched-chain amino acid transport system ATP-binding protein
MNTAAPPTLLSAQGLNRRFGAVVAAADVSIEIAAGERVCLIGSNGAGKTTFVNMVTGYLKPTSGHIRLDGEDITALAPRQITHRGVARSFQIPQLCMHLSVLDNLLASLACSKGERSFFRPGHAPASVAECHHLLARFDLARHADRLVMELPGGVRKLIDIAMALTGQPKLLMLDEPTSGVSSEEKFSTMDTVMNAIGRGTAGQPVAVVFVEHDMDIVSRYASRVIAFYSGRVIADGLPAVVLDDAEVQRHVTGSVRSTAKDAA